MPEFCSRSRVTAVAVAVLLLPWLGGCSGESVEEHRQRIFDDHRRHAHQRCLANAGLANYVKQCEHIGGELHVERRTYVCRSVEGHRNPPELGDGPFCTCAARDASGVCEGEADCNQGIDALCAPVLEAEVKPYLRSEGPADAGVPVGEHPPATPGRAAPPAPPVAEPAAPAVGTAVGMAVDPAATPSGR